MSSVWNRSRAVSCGRRACAFMARLPPVRTGLDEARGVRPAPPRGAPRPPARRSRCLTAKAGCRAGCRVTVPTRREGRRDAPPPHAPEPLRGAGAVGRDVWVLRTRKRPGPGQPGPARVRPPGHWITPQPSSLAVPARRPARTGPDRAVRTWVESAADRPGVSAAGEAPRSAPPHTFTHRGGTSPKSRGTRPLSEPGDGARGERADGVLAWHAHGWPGPAAGAHDGGDWRGGLTRGG